MQKNKVAVMVACNKQGLSFTLFCQQLTNSHTFPEKIVVDPWPSG